MRSLLAWYCVVTAFLLVSPARGAETDTDGTLERDPVGHSKALLDVVARMDNNRDGTLTQNEIPAAATALVSELATAAGLDPQQPIPLNKLSEITIQSATRAAQKQKTDAADQQRAQRRQEERFQQLRLHAAPVGILKRLDRDRNGILEPREVPPEAQSFVQTFIKETGFAHEGSVSLDDLAEMHMRKFDQLTLADLNGTNTDRHNSPASQEEIQQHARNLIFLHDLNGNGSLEKEEWSHLHKDWGQDDTNRDGKLTVHEVANRLITINRVARRN